MRRLFGSAAVIVAVTAGGGSGGCGGSSQAPPAPVASAAHGGILLPLPGDKGFVEFLIESGGGRRGSRDRVVAYFLNRDGSGPPEPPPTDVVFTPKRGRPTTLKPASDILSNGKKFESSPGAFGGTDHASGELSASMGDETVKVPITPQ